ncbi:MAG: serine O-acetyltransferase [Kiritimatiellaeota bacterium]|nr:serine O-acetyltransferase [Kiritimatiellota bacterium]
MKPKPPPPEKDSSPFPADWLDALAQELAPCHNCLLTHPAKKLDLPGREAVTDLLGRIVTLLFPGCHGRTPFMEERAGAHIREHLRETGATLDDYCRRVLHYACPNNTPCRQCGECGAKARDAATQLLGRLPAIRECLREDILAAYEGDPAASSTMEVALSYPGLYAIAVHRVAHALCNLGVPLIPRVMSEHAHSLTGIDIHPGAQIGPGFFIDHGTGVVIGETCVIGRRVKLYQGVTLGALSFQKDGQGNLVKGVKRHPDVEDGVVIYAGATILGGKTVIGRHSVIGGNVWLTQSVPPHSTVYNSQPAPDIRVKNK